jgi:hypothetical protein
MGRGPSSPSAPQDDAPRISLGEQANRRALRAAITDVAFQSESERHPEARRAEGPLRDDDWSAWIPACAGMTAASLVTRLSSLVSCLVSLVSRLLSLVSSNS